MHTCAMCIYQAKPQADEVLPAVDTIIVRPDRVASN